MRRSFYGSTAGLLLGLLLALGCERVTGMDGFAMRTGNVALGYAAAMALGALLGAGLLGRAGGALLGAAVAGLATYVARGIPLPWVNLVALDGGSGPAGEVPRVVLPVLGFVLGVVFAIDGGTPPAAPGGDATPPG